MSERSQNVNGGEVVEALAQALEGGVWKSDGDGGWCAWAGDGASACERVREVRNACAGNAEATSMLIASGAVRGLIKVIERASCAHTDTRQEEEILGKFIMFALQMLVNAGMDDNRALDAVWEVEFLADAVEAVAKLRGFRGSKTHELLCVLVNACVNHDTSRVSTVVDWAQTFWLPLLQASAAPGEADSVGGGANFMTLICTVCCKEDGLPKLFRGLSPNGAHVAALSEALLRARLVALSVDDSHMNEVSDKPLAEVPKLQYISEQATLLHFIAALMDDNTATSYVDIHHSEIVAGEQPPLLMPEGVLAFLVDTTSVAAARFAILPNGEDRDTTLGVLMECVSVLRNISEREVKPHTGDTIACLAAMGLVRLVLAFLASLPPPTGIGQTSKATGPAAAPKLEAHIPKELASDVLYPTKVPWVGYRVDLIAIIGNASFNRVRVCDDIANLGGIPIVLNHTRGEDGEPYLREWSLWAVRNMTQGSHTTRQKIMDLQPRAVEESEELLSRGLGVELNRDTGRPRVVRQEGASCSVAEEVISYRGDADEPEHAEFDIPSNWKVTEL